jgi:hypothetical protein
MRKKIAAAAVGASLLAGGAAGAFLMTPVVATAADGSNSNGSGSSSGTGSGDSAERPAPGQWVKDALAELVEDGTLTQAQADKVAEKLESSRPEGGPMGRGRGPGLSVAAEAIGIEESELLTALRDGQTIADVARSKNVDVQTVIDAIVAEMNSHLDQAVTDGKLTEEQANERKANAAERATDLVNGELPAGGPGGPGGPGGFGGPPPGAPGATDGSTTEEGAATATSI